MTKSCLATSASRALASVTSSEMGVASFTPAERPWAVWRVRHAIYDRSASCSEVEETFYKLTNSDRDTSVSQDVKCRPWLILLALFGSGENIELRTSDEARAEHQHRSIRRNLGQQRHSPQSCLWPSEYALLRHFGYAIVSRRSLLRTQLTAIELIAESLYQAELEC